MNERRWLLGQMQCDKDEGSKRMRANEREREKSGVAVLHSDQRPSHSTSNEHRIESNESNTH